MELFNTVVNHSDIGQKNLQDLVVNLWNLAHRNNQMDVKQTVRIIFSVYQKKKLYNPIDRK
jgi:hypothetical protein